jgi:hypothetical protein
LRLFYGTFYGMPAALALALAMGLAFTPAQAQSADDDLYGVPGEAPVEVSPPPADSAEPVIQDAPLVAPTFSPDPVDTVRTPETPRPRITRETTINPLDVQKGGYRNPKKALFMSLMVPGLGQAYVGQSAFTYARAAVYFGTEVTLGLLWYQYTVVKYDRQVKRYRAHADDHWSLGKYEDRLFQETPQPEGDFAAVNPFRSSYCDAVQSDLTLTGQKLNRGCKEIYTDDAAILSDYAFFAAQHDDQALDAAARSAARAAFADPIEFYALIGGYQEFIAGWDDAVGVGYSDTLITGTSANRDVYNAMRQKAQDYSRMQAWFIGGIVLNHIASAVDAALTARHNNKLLYEGEARWYDRVKMDGGLAFDQGRPRTHMTARLSF